MDKYRCECCGGHINRATMKCEYCGTQYKETYSDNLIRIETFTNPVRSLCVASEIPERELEMLGPDKAAEYAVRTITKKLAEDLIPYVQFEPSRDFIHCTHRLRGEVKVVVPKDNGLNRIFGMED